MGASLSKAVDPTPIAIAVVRRNGRYLVGQRAEGQVLAGLWEFPGGKIQAGESPSEAAVRECREETGLMVRVIELLDETTYRYDHGAVRLFFHLCEPAEGGDSRRRLGAPLATEPKPPYHWLDAAEMRGLRFPPANAEIVARLFAESG